MNNCGISRWDDPDEINSRLKHLQEEPIWEVNDDYYENTVLKYYNEQCKQSFEIYSEAKNFIPGGVQHNLAFNVPFPVAFKKAEGAYLYDQDGNQYIDFLQAGGPTILGSNYPPVKEAVQNLLDNCGPVTGLTNFASDNFISILNTFALVRFRSSLVSDFSSELAYFFFVDSFNGDNRTCGKCLNYSFDSFRINHLNGM